jgi:hypothetical protein
MSCHCGMSTSTHSVASQMLMFFGLCLISQVGRRLVHGVHLLGNKCLVNQVPALQLRDIHTWVCCILCPPEEKFQQEIKTYKPGQGPAGSSDADPPFETLRSGLWTAQNSLQADK